MRAYLKSDLPCLGVYAKPMRELVRRVVLAHPLVTEAEWRAAVLELWERAEYREERYAALAVAGHRLYAPHRTLDALPLWEHLIVDGAWWDLVDAIAPYRIGELLESNPAETAAVLREWAGGDDRWLRRSAIIAQLYRRAETDVELLLYTVGVNVGDRDYFVRKAIGWALREYSKTDADAVRRYVAENADALSPLSRREALKWLEHVHVPRSGSPATARLR